jgi:hypothetical protein
MTSAKTLFLRKDPDGKQSLSQWWASVVHDDRYSMVMTFARAETMELRPTQPQMEGAEIMLATLLTLCDAEETTQDFPGPGLVHKMPVKGQNEPPETED